MDAVTKKGDKYVIPAGTYWVGDPCYAFQTGTEWSDFVEYWAKSNFGNPLVKAGDKWFLAFSTAYGDGCYADLEGFDYPVDAGAIGVVPAEFVEAGFTPFGMRKVRFDEWQMCTAANGVIAIGSTVINTN